MSDVNLYEYIQQDTLVHCTLLFCQHLYIMTHENFIGLAWRERNMQEIVFFTSVFDVDLVVVPVPRRQRSLAIVT